ncbi:MAG: DUF2178 domain-containing protein [Candidatus Paceibacterota bacterium]
MQAKTFFFIRILTAIFLAMIVSVSITLGNFILPLVAMVTAIVFLWTTKKKVQAILEDELDYKIAGEASRLAVMIYAMLSAALGIYFIACRENNYIYEILGSVLCYSTCFLMILQSLIFKYLRNKNYQNIKNED